MSKQLLSENHHFLNAEKDMRSICNSLLNPLGITYFNYLRVYNDRSCCFISTDSNFVKYHFDHNIPVAAPISDNLIKKKFHYLVLPIGNYNKHIHIAKTEFNLAHFIDLVDRHDDYFELFCFGSAPNNPEILNFYLSNMDFLEKFKFYFKEKALCLLKNREKNKIILTEQMNPPFLGLKYTSISNDTSCSTKFIKNKYCIRNEKYDDIKLTPRQYDCLIQLAAGCTAKEASRNLGISHRTFENYLANLKSILNCHKKSQLINLFLNNTFQSMSNSTS